MFGFKGLVGVVCLATLVASARKVSTHVEVTTQPEAARVVVDGESRGLAPLQLFNLAPGRHLFHVESKGFRSIDEIVTVEDGVMLQKNFELEPEKALVLVRTEPSGAEVKFRGVVLGQTPLFVSSLPTDDTHTLELLLPGYRPAKIQVRPEGRRPFVATEKLMIDSGTLECVTDPPGAEVVVNGIAHGVTPTTVSNVAKGGATVSFRLRGYRSETRQVVVSPDGRTQRVEVKMVGLPGVLRLVSTPEGAKAFVDGNYQGKTPTTAPDLAAGEHKVRLELDGHATQERTVVTENGGDTTETFTMESVLGRIEVSTVPAGAKITIDGKAVGTTRSVPGSSKSAVLAVEKVSAGERSVVASAIGCQDVSRKVKVPPKGTASVTIMLKRLFVPDTEIETIQGTMRRGVLIGDGKDLDGVHLEVSPGVEQVFPHDQIRKLRQLSRE